MPAIATSLPHAPARVSIAAETLRGLLLWLLGFSGAFVFIEPSPYEIIGIVAILLFAVTGLTLRAAVVPLLLLLLLLNLGYAMSVVQVSNQMKPVVWVLVSAFLAGTAVFYAAAVATNTRARVAWLMAGLLAAALLAALAAIAAYFRLAGGTLDMFLLYGRARGTFNDPNVLGAFLMLPGLLLLQRILAWRQVVRSALMLAPMLVALLLTFSRGAWGAFVLSALILMALTFLTTASPGERLRIVAVAVAGLLLAVALLAAIVAIPQVGDLFAQRAALEQSYDVGRYGRFGRYLLGAELGLEHPLGIGPLQFARYFTEDAHNTFLNAFMSGGWLTGFAYITLCAVTLARSTRLIFVRTPWQPAYLAVYAAYVGIVAESVIIDIDHWRHYFLVLGVLWGLMAATREWLAQAGAVHRMPYPAMA